MAHDVAGFIRGPVDGGRAAQVDAVSPFLEKVDEQGNPRRQQAIDAEWAKCGYFT